MRSGAALDNAPRTTSVIRCEVSTLPAAIAAGRRAFTTVPSGAITAEAEDAGGERNVVRDQAAENVHYGCQRHGVVGVDRTLAWDADPVKSTVARNRPTW